MKKQGLFLALVVALFSAACSKKSAIIDPPVTDTTKTSNTVTVTGDIATATTWKADKIYLIKGFVYVTNGATLTIEPGTLIKGDKASKGTLTVTRGAKIMAVGTADKPIVFTSSFGVGTRAPGDWGGIVVVDLARVVDVQAIAALGGNL